MAKFVILGVVCFALGAFASYKIEEKLGGPTPPALPAQPAPVQPQLPAAAPCSVFYVIVSQAQQSL